MAEYLGHLAVEVGHAVFHVDEKQDDISLFSGQNHLLAYFFFKNVVRVDHPSAGVDDGKLLAAPLAFAILAVARGSGHIAHNGLPRTGQTIEQCAFAHVGTTYYCY